MGSPVSVLALAGNPIATQSNVTEIY